MNIILGIDPGSRTTGYGVIEKHNNKLRYIDSGCIRTQTDDFPERLHIIFSNVSEIIQLHQPTHAAIEQVFMHENADSALKLGQARGSAIVAMKQHQLTVAEYSARSIKQAVVGHGGAEKAQVQQMICHLLNLPKTPQADAADALAIAICHAHQYDMTLKESS